jgi:hypothetical protein
MSDKYDDISGKHMPKCDLEIYSAFGWISVLSVLIAGLACNS